MVNRAELGPELDSLDEDVDLISLFPMDVDQPVNSSIDIALPPKLPW